MPQIREGEVYQRSITATVETAERVSVASDLVRADAANGILATRGKAPNGEQFHVRFVMSTEDVASDGGIILASGWVLERFTANPVFLWCHEYHEAPIGRVVHVEVKGRQLIGWVLFDEEDDFARKILSKYERGFMSAVSVGFRPMELRSEWSQPGLTDAEKKKGARWISILTELLELSAVPVPADAKALKKSHSADAAPVIADPANAGPDAREAAANDSSTVSEGSTTDAPASEPGDTPGVEPTNGSTTPAAMDDVQHDAAPTADEAREAKRLAAVKLLAEAIADTQ